MKLSLIAVAVAVFLSFPLMLGAQANFPRMTSVDPMTVKVGDVVTASGEHLDKDNVAELFLTDNKSDFKVEITAQEATAIKFRVPESVKAGRFGLVIRTPGSAANPAKDYVQPVKVTVE
ncbi:MAG: hypothetical protein IT159_03365 [Bryobacterales bacterium]|jgi:hypothetical protein|nr:hypothetical protein [Bryobacterales bacterium]